MLSPRGVTETPVEAHLGAVTEVGVRLSAELPEQLEAIQIAAGRDVVLIDDTIEHAQLTRVPDAGEDGRG